MPLIKCPECSAEISDQATSCPKCGYPLRPSGLQATPNADALLIETLQREGKIAAIKLHRDNTQCGLAEAKQYVDQLEALLPAGSLPRPRQRGCLSVFILAALMIAACIVVALRAHSGPG
jgi:hypothetical protein